MGGLWAKTLKAEPPDKMVQEGLLGPLVVPTRWVIFGVAIYMSSVWPYGVRLSYTERSVGRRLCVYLIGWVATLHIANKKTILYILYYIYIYII